MRTTQKKLIETFKNSKGEIYVNSFEDGQRITSYGGLDLLSAFNFIVQQTSVGRQIVITDKEGDRAGMRWEIENGGRVPYEYLKDFALKKLLQYETLEI